MRPDATFGATKLNKILWWADFLAYAKLKKPITGVSYQKLPNGPAPRQLVVVRKKLEREDGANVSKELTVLGTTRHRLVPRRKPDLSMFTVDQIALVDEIITELWNKSAEEVSRGSHGKAWELAKDGENIPYEAIFLSDDAPTGDDILRTYELSEEHGWE